jgi:excisionase family DNA binding protein
MAKQEKAGLFVRIPVAEAEKLDRAAFELKARKQDLIAGLVSRYVDPSSPEKLAQLGQAAMSSRRVTVEAVDDTMQVGRATFQPAAEPIEVLTQRQAADLLQTDPAIVEAMAEAGELPARKLGDQWRFSREAILNWLAASTED